MVTATAPMPGVQTVSVEITDAGCVPTTFETTSGPTTFEATTDRTDEPELEIIDGDRLLGEVAGLAPALTGTFSVTLDPGEYDMRCGQHSDPVTGTLTVLGDQGAGTTAAGDEAVEAYREFVLGQTEILIARTGEFADAVKAGDIDEAKDLFAYAREPYERIEPVAEAFGDLDPAIDAREGDVPKSEWTGFHRIEKALWVDERPQRYEAHRHEAGRRRPAAAGTRPPGGPRAGAGRERCERTAR